MKTTTNPGTNSGINSGTNLWTHSNRESAATTRLTSDRKADLVIIGGGFTGCAAALEAARRGASVILLEAETIGHGGSGRNVGLVNAGLWLPPDQVMAEMGEVAGSRLVAALGEGPATVFGLIKAHGIDCEAARAGTLHLAHAPSGMRDLQNRHRQGNRQGVRLELLNRAETRARTGSAAFHGALLDPRAGTVQPRAYCTGLARAAIEHGAMICEKTPVVRVAHGAEGWQVETGGHRVQAAALLLATNAYHAGLPGSYAPQYALVGYSQFATVPLPEDLRGLVLPGGEGCWDTALVMSSIRTDAEGRLIVGGMGDAEGVAGRIHESWARRKLRALYPELADLPFEHEWSGRIAMTGDHIPKVVAFGPHALACFGYSGRGICPGTVIGTAAAQALLEDAPEVLPLPVLTGYSEALGAVKSGWYELGAALVHATAR